MIPRVPRPVLVAVLVVVTLAGAYALGRRSVKPIREVVDKEIVKIVERLIPGEMRTVIRDVPGPTRTEIIRVPVEVARIVREVGPERVVTVTRPVDVPVEVIRREWPQTITVTVGSVLSGGQWYVPDFPDLTIGQVTPGVYAVGAMPGWKIEAVTTETRLDVPAARIRLPYHLGIEVGVIAAQPYTGIIYQNEFAGGYYRVTTAYGFPGLTWGVAWTLPLR